MRSRFRILIALSLLLLVLMPSQRTAPQPQPILPSHTPQQSWELVAKVRDERLWNQTVAWNDAAPQQGTATAAVEEASSLSEESQHVAHFDPGSVQQLIVDVFGAEAPAALTVAKCESGFDPYNVNPSNRHVRGVFQIHDSWAATWLEVMGVEYEQTWMDASTNIRFAKWLYDQDGSWKQWACRP